MRLPCMQQSFREFDATSPADVLVGKREAMSVPVRRDRCHVVAQAVGLPSLSRTCWGARLPYAHRRVHVQPLGQLFKDLVDCPPFAFINLAKSGADRRFDGSSRRRVEALSRACQFQHGPSPISGMGNAIDETLGLEPLQDTSQRAGVKMQDAGEASGRNAGCQAYHPYHESLWSRHSQRAVHLLRRLLQAVHGRPQDAHELKGLVQFDSSGGVDRQRPS